MSGLRRFVLTMVGGLVCSMGLAHDRFLLPSHTVLSGEAPQQITLISSISNDHFHPDRPFGDNGRGVAPPSLKSFFDRLQSQLIGPDGSQSEGLSWQAFARLSVTDLALKQSGTWRVGLIQPKTLMTTYLKADGSHGRAFGPKPELPKGATQIVRRLTHSRVETFVTLNKPTSAGLKPTGDGLELGGKTHPNDVFINELASFQIFCNGHEPGAPVQITVVKGGTRHRNQRNAVTLETDERGVFKTIFKEPGFYLLQANLSMDGDAASGVDKESYGLFVTIEVFPE